MEIETINDYGNGKLLKNDNGVCWYSNETIEAGEYAGYKRRLVSEFDLVETSRELWSTDQTMHKFRCGKYNIDIGWDNWDGLTITPIRENCNELLEKMAMFIEEI